MRAMRRVALRSALAALLLMLPAFSPAQQGGEAEKLFRAMEARLGKAAGINLGFTIAADKGAMQAFKLKGTLALARGDRVNLQADVDVGGMAVKVGVVSDGSQVRRTATGVPGGLPAKDLRTRRNLSAALVQVLSRSGIFAGM